MKQQRTLDLPHRVVILLDKPETEAWNGVFKTGLLAGARRALKGIPSWIQVVDVNGDVVHEEGKPSEPKKKPKEVKPAVKVPDPNKELRETLEADAKKTGELVGRTTELMLERNPNENTPPPPLPGVEDEGEVETKEDLINHLNTQPQK